MARLLLLLALCCGLARGATDLAQQIYDNTAITAPVAPRSLNTALTKLVGDVSNFTSLSPRLQRALLWSTGWVRAIPSTAASASGSYSSSAQAETESDLYAQVYVVCGRTMSDVFLTASSFENKTLCPLHACKNDIVSLTMSTCEASYVEDKTLCALSPAAADAPFTLQQRDGPMWAMDGQIDGTFDPQLFQFEDSNTTVFMLAQKDTWNMNDVDCPNSAQFIAPCREVDATEVDDSVNERTWCEPEMDLGVTLWFNEEMAGSSSTDTDSSSSSKVSVSIVIVLAVLLALLLVGCLVLCVMLRRSRRSAKQNDEQGSFFVSAQSFRGQRSEPQAHGNPQLDHMAGRPTVGGAQYASNNGPYMSFDTAAQVEAVNESFRQRSAALSAFCDDQELMLKRIAFAGIVYREKLSSGANGEVWRGEYEGQQVAIKCSVAAAAAAAAAAANSSRGSTGTATTAVAAALGDKELKALEAFTKEIRMAAFLDHPNIMHFVGLSWRTLPDLCMVSEFAALGDLAHFLALPESKNLTWKDEKLALAGDISNALVYLHSLSPVVLHRDLKSLNVLLTEDLQAKVSDFGLSRETSYDETMTSGVGTLLWTAPEVLRGERYSEKADIYSFGVVLSELDTCLPPYSLNPGGKKKGGKANNMDWVPLIASGQATPTFRPDCPPALLELAVQCLDQDPSKRPPAMQIVYLLRSKIRLTL
ncbi:hypothetical protein BBJ28_00006017 [Nothophytophthora sp. Chile5]|nr:hypothetical protein BBJ28_00006017 [Nothophytophthora sp. Chile5]